MSTSNSKSGRTLGIIAIVLTSLTVVSGAVFGVLFATATQAKATATATVAVDTVAVETATQAADSARTEAALYLACIGDWWCSALHPGTPLSDYADAKQAQTDAENNLEFDKGRLKKATSDAQLMLILLIAVPGALLLASAGTGIPALRARRLGTSGVVASADLDIAPPVSGAAPAAWICTECKTENASGIFCLNCGAKHNKTGGAKDGGK
jgi:flagellar basal body-associated protein FliL